MAQWNKNTQDFLNQERTLFEVFNVATSDGEQVTVDNPFPVSLGSSSITIIGDITIPGIVSVTSSIDNPIHNHIVEVGTSSSLTTPYLPVGVGTVNLNLSYLPVGISSLLNIVSVSSITSPVTVQGTVGIGTTGQVSLNLNNSPVSSSNPLPVTGTLGISTTSTVSVTFPAHASDAFGRLRVSNPLTLFDSSHRYRDNNLWTGLVVGTGSTVGFSTVEGLVNLGIGTTAGCSIIRETTKVFSYQPGKSLLVMTTFVMNAPKTNLRQRVGYYGADNGIYLELDGDTLYLVERSLSLGTETRIPQSSWNGDKLLDGTGPSGITLDISNSQILWMDIEWLGMGTVRTGFVINGVFIIAHSFHHANIIKSTYVTTASLPLRYEIANTGITTSSSNIKQVCSSVISEGGYELRGLQQAIGTPITSPTVLSVAGTLYPIISLRLKSTSLDAIVILTTLSLMGAGNGISYNWQIRASGTTTGGTWTSAGADSAVEYNITATSFTGGRTLASGFFNSANQGSPSINILKEALFKFQLERNGLTGTPFELTLIVAASPISSSESVYASMDWEEISR